MSYVIAAPEMMTSAATDLATIGSDLTAAHTAAATPTVALVPAAADEVSASISHLFSGYAQAFQGLAGKAAVFHDQFVATLTSGAHSYAATEAAAVASLGHAAAGIPIPTTSGVLESLLQLLVPLHQWFLTWPANIQGFVNDITYPLAAITAFVVIFGVLLVGELLILLTSLGL